MAPFAHGYDFDPSYGYDLNGLLAVEPPPEPPGFAGFWRACYQRALEVDPGPRIVPATFDRAGFAVFDLAYRSTDDFPIGGWVLVSTDTAPTRGFVVGHGYGGLAQPDGEVPFTDAVYLIPCFRGLGRSRCPPISDHPEWHVLHDIHLRDRYIIRGCVEDLWTGVSALLRLFPGLAGRVGYLGVSFGGGIGALGIPWDGRLGRGHLELPSFGHQPLRLQLPTSGSAASVQTFARRNGRVLETLAYYDAAVAARHIRIPVQVAAALFDPAVAPPCQFAIYNALTGDKRLFVLTAGHFDYPGREAEARQLRRETKEFLTPL